MPDSTTEATTAPILRQIEQSRRRGSTVGLRFRPVGRVQGRRCHSGKRADVLEIQGTTDGLDHVCVHVHVEVDF